jgi:hypothetical protein
MLSTISFSRRLAGFAWLCCVKKGASVGAKVCAASLQTYHELSLLLRPIAASETAALPPEASRRCVDLPRYIKVAEA